MASGEIACCFFFSFIKRKECVIVCVCPCVCVGGESDMGEWEGLDLGGGGATGRRPLSPAIVLERSCCQTVNAGHRADQTLTHTHAHTHNTHIPVWSISGPTDGPTRVENCTCPHTHTHTQARVRRLGPVVPMCGWDQSYTVSPEQRDTSNSSQLYYLLFIY